MIFRPRFLLILLLAGSVVTPAHARLGETLAEIRQAYGRPESQPRKDNALWMFEGKDGLLLYTVTFNAEGRSIAEGLKPIRRAKFTRENALDFIESQLAPHRDSKTLVVIKPGEKYRFAGQEFVCADVEHVVVDEPNGLLLIWNQSVFPSVMVVAPEMLGAGG